MSTPVKPGAPESDTLGNVLGILRRRWVMIVAIVIACTAVAVAKHVRTTKSYQASSNVSFQSGTLSDAALQVSPSGGGEPQREADTEVLIAHSPEVAEGVRKQLRLNTSAAELLNEVKVEAAANANVLNIIASTGNPQESAALANAFAEQYIAFRAQSELAGISTSEAKLQQQVNELPVGSPERATLEASLQRLGSLRAVAGGGANIIGRATPPGEPSGMGLSATAMIGLLLGLAIAFAVVFVLESLDRRIKSIEEFERDYRMPALTAVPQSAFRHQSATQRGEMLEPYRILRSALDFAAVTRQMDTLLVTSATSGEGKTTVAIDLAHAIGLTGRRVVLVELDLRRPTFARQLDLDGSVGLTNALTGGDSASELLVEPFPDVPNLSVLPSGRLPHRPSEVLGSSKISDVISELASPGGIVILDAPPLNPVADTQVLLNNPVIQAAIIVARLDQTTRDEVKSARAILDRHFVDPVGLVVTGMRDSARYGYGTYSGETPTLDVGVGPAAADDAESGRRRKLRL